MEHHWCDFWLQRKQKKGFLGTGILLRNQPISQDIMAIPMHARHCVQLSLSVPANLFNNSTITTWRRIMTPTTIQNHLFFFSLSKMFFPFTVLNMVKIWQRTKMLKINVSFSRALSLKVDSPSNCMAYFAWGFQQDYRLKELEQLMYQLSTSPTVFEVLHMESYLMKSL